MPELPEVETARRGLEQALSNKKIELVEVRRRDLRWPIPDDFEEIAHGQTIQNFGRIGKYLHLDLTNSYSILGHLGMSGTFRVEPSYPQQLRTHDHIVIQFESKETAIFNDARRFGFLLLSKTEALRQHPRLIHMGPDPFDKANFNVSYLTKALSRRSGAIKPILLNQNVVSGIGNIYASEALFSAKIHPNRPADSLSKSEISLLIKSVRVVLTAAIASGGSTLRDFSGTSGQAGYFQHSFNVYGHANQPCRVCKNPLKVAKLAGRSTFFCEICQK